MQELREIKKIKEKKVSITLPPSFKTEVVEVIILPAENNQKKSKQKSISELLLKVPTVSEKEINAICKTKNLIDEWKIEEEY